jgi:predicted nucleic acid-binding protein
MRRVFADAGYWIALLQRGIADVLSADRDFQQAGFVALLL